MGRATLLRRAVVLLVTVLTLTGPPSPTARPAVVRERV